MPRGGLCSLKYYFTAWVWSPGGANFMYIMILDSSRGKGDKGAARQPLTAEGSDP
jgi:hypothetical protein